LEFAASGEIYFTAVAFVFYIHNFWTGFAMHEDNREHVQIETGGKNKGLFRVFYLFYIKHGALGVDHVQNYIIFLEADDVLG